MSRRGSERSLDGGESETFERFPTCEEIARKLLPRFPTLDPEIVMDFAYAVSINKYDYRQAKGMLANLVEVTAVEVAVADAVQRENNTATASRQPPKAAAGGSSSSSSSSSAAALVEQRAVAMLERDHLKHHHAVVSSSSTPSHTATSASASSASRPFDAQQQVRQPAPTNRPPPFIDATPTAQPSTAPAGPSQRQGDTQPIASAMLQSAHSGGHHYPSEVESAGFGAAEVLLYTTSMTSMQQVRDHTRLLQNLLYIRRVKYAELDLADNAFLQRRLATLCGYKSAADLTLPVLFVGEQPVGGYEKIQDLEDRDVFMPRLAQLGFVYEPVSLPTPGVYAEEDDCDGY